MLPVASKYLQGENMAPTEHCLNEKPLSEDELKRLRRFLKAFPDENAADQAVELLETYRALGHLGKLSIGFLKILAVVSAGIIAWFQLRGIWTGKGGV